MLSMKARKFSWLRTRWMTALSASGNRTLVVIYLVILFLLCQTMMFLSWRTTQSLRDAYLLNALRLTCSAPGTVAPLPAPPLRAYRVAWTEHWQH